MKKAKRDHKQSSERLRGRQLSKRNDVDSLHDNGNGYRNQVQNKSARVYVFGEGDIDEEEIIYEAELTEVRARGKARQDQLHSEKTQAEEDTYIERNITEDDTLQNIALKYGCRVSELKRLNNLIRDQDFYALTTIKVPMKRFGLLTELMQDEGQSKNGLYRKKADVLEVMEANDMDEEDEEVDASDQRQLLVRTVSIRDAVSSQSKDAVSFLKKMDSDIHKIIQSTNLRMGSLEEVTKSLTCKRIQPFRRQTSWLNGADCGIRWWSVLIFFVVVGLLMPTFFILFVKYGKPET